ncbi:MAG: STAS/SEC14 domain-containing protein [Desulfobacterales bacterium]|jgi:hypothetical protein|nr:STAS/SEC14 domain-containing protein [Desulfobacterales bacterium]
MTIGFNEIDLRHINGKKIIQLKFVGELTKEDYEAFVPQLNYILKNNKDVRILVQLIDFKGWTLGAFWEDTKFSVRHFGDIKRLAIVGDRNWQKGFPLVIAPFTKAEVRYFDTHEKDTAQTWVQE